MTRYVLSPLAKRDIEDIWNYTVARWNADQAERYIRQIQANIEAIAADPQLGRAIDEIRPRYRRFPAGSHVLFYRLTKTGVNVVRVLHARMDFSRHL